MGTRDCRIDEMQPAGPKGQIRFGLFTARLKSFPCYKALPYLALTTPYVAFQCAERSNAGR